MRPLDKGLCPTENNVEIVVTDYTHWRNHLIQRIGYYCAYCNIPLSHSLNVEHVVPKNPHDGDPVGDVLTWENMLLACGPCNNAKSNNPVDFSKLYFPEENNTLLAFDVSTHTDNPQASIIVPKLGLTHGQTEKADNTINLLGLTDVDNRPNIVDIRWKRRRGALIAAEASLDLFNRIKQVAPDDIETAGKYIAINAAEIGFFIVWFKVFANEPIVIKHLTDTELIPGTAQSCFDAEQDYNLINRNPENEIDPI
ncbi:HNH endonuclease [Pedobacter frigoris]|uniref:HNH endonuclease n=1 Tax=Pedobacter frigoris TaxID=2571272 RepID=A0A4U1CKX4_9SPHI|nr:HNH endonuclease [Pedobacter frigoris]TKC07492.1 HNH endonuclease [Pedobacter frigoris]